MAGKTKKPRSFESSLKDLEKMVGVLEKGETPLEDQLKAFEKGVQYSRECLTRLDEIEKRVEKVLEGPDGELEATTFES